ncbi:aldehyde dehydrogenase [Thauera linaloolentis]|uniref:Aldehyde dehydrogenase n=1 Tax=Thauera linaloolentis (strain DSM 12138 / JCM 21573 / CCUG 41526 / CIP 105981 / IAM 15112 / NBRC 102519 / 47Lol) TaxID=1123367 RepID=N6YPB5_THAL4|nr:aldehyde dehydrogenase [Thauera linaloolentis]ENO84222.1 aldehyde dehydrogenase [Thauera linaloolentis 47Lol = DSM 12138]MCM8566776.1 aldehyde dehydrogenase [Thauera linaloolentis]
MQHAPLLISNNDLAASGNASFDCRNPVSGEVVTRAAAASVADATAAVDAAAAAFGPWGEVLPAERQALLHTAADLLLARADRFEAAIVSETGTTPAWAHFNCRLAADILREAAAMVTHIQGDVIPSNRPGSMAMVLRQPAGVVLAFAPWNAPVLLGVRAIAMPLACGNTVVLKGSELSPLTHRLIGDVLRDAGFPPGVCNVVLNAPADSGPVVEALIAHPAVRRVSFTGSTRVGRVVAERCARHLKPCLLGLGGKAPLLVLDDADIGEAVKAAAFGVFFNQGQICMSTERILVDRRIADDFIARLAARARTLAAGASGCPLGSMISIEAAERVRQLVDDAVQKGAELIAGGGTSGSIAQATLLDHVTPTMRLYHEETFGPIAAVMRFDDIEEAISIANDSDYGLSAAVFGRDTLRALQVARRIESAICHINGPTVQDEAQIPFGGLKASGWGRFGGKPAIDEFTELRWISIQTQPQDYPL